jgi:hypothetical protein
MLTLSQNFLGYMNRMMRMIAISDYLECMCISTPTQKPQMTLIFQGNHQIMNEIKYSGNPQLTKLRIA